MDAVAEVWRPHAQVQDASRDEAEDGQEHRRFSVLRIFARDQVGAGYYQPSHPQRSPEGEEAHRNGTAPLGARSPDAVRNRTMVPRRIPRRGGSERRAAWGGPGSTLVGPSRDDHPY